jgi:DNA-binding NtrC family response regulator
VSSSSGRSTILVVEDEPLLRLFAADTVEDAGFTAIAASGVDEALRALETRADVAVVFTDVDMPPGRDGLHLAATVSERWPDVGIVVTSGKPFSSAARIPARAVFHPKPYTQGWLVATLRRMTG